MAMNAAILGRELTGLISGSVEWDADVLDGYSADASLYRIRPTVVVFPRNREDVIRVVRFAAKNGIGVTPRGGGTGLVGSGIGEGIIMSLRDMNEIVLADGHVTVGAGTSKGALDRILDANDKFLSPNPSVGPYCTIGGMIATNASGTLSVKYGSMVDNILEVEFVDGRGHLHKFPDDSPLSSAILDIANGTDRGRFPKVRKNSCGYRLDAVSSAGTAHKILAGSEGTLGIVVSARLRIRNRPPARILFVYGYKSPYDAAEDCKRISQIGLSSIEFVDREMAEMIGEKFPETVRCLLYVEVDEDLEEADELQEKMNGVLIKRTDDDTEMNKWWKYRHSSMLYVLRNISTGPHIFEDAAVPIEDLDRLLRLIEKIEDRFNIRAILYGHMGSGNPHVMLVPIQRDEKVIREIAEMYFTGVIEIGGTLTGEHGDGQVRTEFIRQQYGDEIFFRFQQLKRLLDPDGILNPGKIISEESQIVKNLVLD